MLTVGVDSANAKGGGTAKPPQGAASPFVEPTLGDPTFSADRATLHGFDDTGYLQDATVDTGMKDASGQACANPGGSVTINNLKIVVPCNLTIQMPANTFTWADFIN